MILQLGGLILVAAVCLFALNNWHATRCSSKRSKEDIEAYIENIKDRLLEAESQNIKNTLVIQNTLRLLENKLYKLESSEIDYLSIRSQEDSVKLNLELSKLSSPLHVSLDWDKKFDDREALADLIDETMRSYEETTVTSKDAGGTKGNIEVDKQFTENNYYSASANSVSSSDLSEEDTKKLCTEWQKTYSVVKGASWGYLPYDLQKKWVTYHCDYHIAELSS